MRPGATGLVLERVVELPFPPLRSPPRLFLLLLSAVGLDAPRGIAHREVAEFTGFGAD